MDELICPKCGSHLDAGSDHLACAACRNRFRVADGVPHFVDEFPYWGEIPQDRMQEILGRIESANWQAALLEHSDPVVRRASGMILNLERANWHCLLDLPPSTRALDMGAGTGTTSHALARDYREVVAIEPVLERVQFMQRRFEQEGLNNVRVIRSSLWSIPYPADSFDLVAMNGVLEWVASGLEGDPEQLQLRALENVRRLLRPGGYLYVGIENRLSWGHFLGWPDPHCGLPWAPILPRPLAHWYARKKGQDGYRNYLYSSRGYRKLLGKAGFREMELYIAIPSYNHPRVMIPLHGSLYSYYRRNCCVRPERLLQRLAGAALLHSGALKHLEGSFVILARK